MMGPRRPSRQTPPKYAEDERILAEHRFTLRGRAPTRAYPKLSRNGNVISGTSVGMNMIQEKCGDGVMSAVDVTLELQEKRKNAGRAGQTRLELRAAGKFD
jgi:cyanate lyase